eukprot:NODE_452_length_7258_cov_0.721050.p2 type:complete len:372 gc:universal NODE_452_length_7258_cov_0.721050:1276-161(-)
MLFALLCVLGVFPYNSLSRDTLLTQMKWAPEDNTEIAAKYKGLFDRKDFKSSDIINLELAWPVNALIYAAEWFDDQRPAQEKVKNVVRLIIVSFNQLGAEFTQHVYYNLMIQLFENVFETQQSRLSDLLRDFATFIFVYRPNSQQSQRETLEHLSEKYNYRFTYNLVGKTFSDRFVAYFLRADVSLKYPKYFTAFRTIRAQSFDLETNFYIISKRYPSIFQLEVSSWDVLLKKDATWMVNDLYYLAELEAELGDRFVTLATQFLESLHQLDSIFTQNGAYTGFMIDLFYQVSETDPNRLSQLLIDFATFFFVYRPESYKEQKDVILNLAEEYGNVNLEMREIGLLSEIFIDPYVAHYKRRNLVQYFPTLYE